MSKITWFTNGVVNKLIKFAGKNWFIYPNIGIIAINSNNCLYELPNQDWVEASTCFR